MPRYQLRISLRNSPEALAKLMLLLKQGQLSLAEATIKSNTSGFLDATLILDGLPEKIRWLSRKTENFPFFRECVFREASE